MKITGTAMAAGALSRNLDTQMTSQSQMMNKLKLFGIVSKRLRKYNSNHGTQDPIKTGLIKRNFNAIYQEYKWYSDMSEFRLNNP